MSNWRKMRELAKYKNTDPSLTDQSQAHETDINVIVGRMGIGGTVPGNAQQPMYGDFTELPTDLRGFLEQARQLETLREQLPKELRGQKLEELLSMTPEQVAKLLTPATPEPKKETTE